jgi:hypothetical protein
MNFSFDDIKNLVSALAIVAVPVSHYLYNLLLQHMGTQRAGQVQDLANVVVRSVEQSMSDSSGADKKAAAVSAMDTLIKCFGLSRFASPTLVNAVIEGAVQVMNSASAQPQPAVATSVSVPVQAGQSGVLSSSATQ